MNQGKDVFKLMEEIKLPPELEVGEGYGNLPWSVRGIYEGYAGWFDGNPTSMYPVPRAAVSKDVVELAGGPAALLARSRALAEKGDLVSALHLVDTVLEAAPGERPALEAKIALLEQLLAASQNSNERGWLVSGIKAARARLDG